MQHTTAANPTATHHRNTPPQHTTATHRRNTPPQHTSATHHRNTPLEHTAATHHRITPPHHTSATHLRNTPLQRTAATHHCNTPPQHTIATHHCNTLLQHTFGKELVGQLDTLRAARWFFFISRHVGVAVVDGPFHDFAYNIYLLSYTYIYICKCIHIMYTLPPCRRDGRGWTFPRLCL